jgi:ParB family chromosome partitioning protein
VSDHALPQIEIVPLDAIDIRTNARAVDPAWASVIAASFEERGQIQAIQIRSLGDDRYVLIDGGHRVEAMRLLGRDSIVAEIRPIDVVDADILAIDANLIRNELSALDRAVFLFQRKQLWEAKYPETANGKAKKPKKNNGKEKIANLAIFHRFTIEVANRTGISERTSQRATELMKGLGPQIVALLRGTRLSDNQSQLQALMRIESDATRLAAAEAIAAHDLPSVSAALKAIGAAPEKVPDDEADFRRLLDLWSRSGRKTRRKFLDAIGLSDEAGAEDAVTARRKS